MEFKLLHNGKSITDSVKFSKCFSCDRYGGMLDDLTISFSTDGHTIEFNENDELEIKTDDGLSTGVMYLDSCVGNDGEFTIKALSCRHKNKKRKSKIWHKVRLSKIISDVAANTGLTPLLYEITDHSYASVSQIMETDLQLLARLCKREGYSIKCDNGNLIIFNENYLESNSTPLAISKEDVGIGYSFNRCADGLSSMTVRYFDINTLKNISYTSTDDSISGGEDTKVEFLSGIDEAHRFSVGYLRDANKFYVKGFLPMAYNGKISAGTVCDLSGFDEFDGRYVAYEVRTDFMNQKTACKVRKILGY